MMHRHSIHIRLNTHKFIYLIFFSVYFFLNSYLTFFNDDLQYMNGPEICGSLSNWVIYYYNNWSGRLLHALYVPFVRSNVWIFRTANTFIMLLLMFLFERLCAYSIIQENRPTPHPSVTLASGALVLCTTSYNTVLWGCASVSYVWGIAACLATVYIVGLSLNGKPIKKACWVVASVCACYAAYAEQPAATLLGFLLIFILIFLLFRQPIPYFVLVISLLTLINSIVNLIAPGNQIRDFTETISRWPDFGSYTLIQKLALGCSYTLDALTGPLARYVFIAVGFLILNLHINRQWVSTVLCILILGYFGCACLQDFFPVFRHLFNFIPGDNLYGWGFPQLLCTGLFLFVWFGLIALISIGDTAPDWFGGILGLAVFANLLIMGFSPTIYASAERPFYVSNLLINLLSLRFFFRFSIVKKVPYWIHWGLAILICLYAALTLFRSIF